MPRRLRSILRFGAVAALIAAASIAVGLAVTPDQQISTIGQTIEVGVTGPSTDLSGPGELDLFGQKLDTTVQFAGPVRPRIRLTQITLPKQLKDFAHTTEGTDPATSISNALVTGFRHFLIWQIIVVGLTAILLAGAGSGWMRRGWGFSLAFIASILIITEAINVGAIMSTAYTATDKLSQVRSLQALVGDAPELQARPATAPQRPGSSIVVIGDSTAAGLGLRALPDPTKADEACKRSIDSFAAALANVSDGPVINLACSSATISEGILGSQVVKSMTVPPQLSQSALADASTVIVSIGANDVRWADQLLVCAISVSCQNNAQQAAFQQDLAMFSIEYLQLLSALQALPNHPEVVINLYYDPFGSNVDCLAEVGVTTDKQRAMLSKLSAINEVLRTGAEAASFKVAAPNFADHGLCSPAPFVQGVKAKAPFHPTPGGEVAIALAVERALRND